MKPKEITVSPSQWGIWGDSILAEQFKNDEKQTEKMNDHIANLERKGFIVHVTK